MAKDIPVEGLGAEVADLITAVERRIRRAVKAELDPLDLTWAQARVLRVLGREGEPLRMSELADRLRIARRSATSLVDEVAARGLVGRATHTEDRRTVTVALTSKGRAVLARQAERRQRVTTRLTAPLSRAELVTLRDLLHQLDGTDLS